jgi:hypothetical protein
MKGLLAALLIAGIALAYTPAYPCTYCHTPFLSNLNGNVHKVPYHKIDLTVGAHAGLYCSNCHDPKEPMKLVNGAVVVPLNLASREDLMKYNTLCAKCHPRVYADYLVGAHGNSTFVCQGGEKVFVIGYKGAPYWYHQCNSYTNLKVVPGRPCVFCHNPHDPIKPPANIMPPPSDRPKPYPQDAIAYSTAFLMILATALSVFAYLKR